MGSSQANAEHPLQSSLVFGDIPATIKGGKGQQPNAYGLYHPTSNHPSSNFFSTHWVIPLLSLPTFARPKIFRFDIRCLIDPPTSEVFQTT
ncbi:hypothetical protein FCULG_00006010 [Fusarium culmorum]|uniref:Uncharacterized protein n=1 Tax=Fusarium culmorum TaxID=5516 RepID=A0A2T4GWZ6_FUSCU|nr:hypothetical protein FCULG_00006010 [Fusarium culmorum]